MVTHKRLREGKRVFCENNARFAVVVDLNKCLNQIKLPILLDTCAPFPELPLNISTMSDSICHLGMMEHQHL